MTFWRKQAPPDHSPLLRCSFCNKSSDDVQKLIAGPAVFICDECVEVCNEILANDAAGERPHAPDEASAACVLCTRTISPGEGLQVRHGGLRGLLCSECEAAIDEARASHRDSASSV